MRILDEKQEADTVNVQAEENWADTETGDEKNKNKNPTSKEISFLFLYSTLFLQIHIIK